MMLREEWAIETNGKQLRTVSTPHHEGPQDNAGVFIRNVINECSVKVLEVAEMGQRIHS